MDAGPWIASEFARGGAMAVRPVPRPRRGPCEGARLFRGVFYEPGSTVSGRAKKRTRNATPHRCPQELTLLQERQLSLERTNEIDPPLQPC
jgi:hypothetical protein